MGKGGGGTTQSTGTTYTTNIPEYAEGYVNTMLGATQKQLFNMDGNEITGFKPYTPYSTSASDYVAPFSPMQEQAMRTAANPEAFGQQVQGYMSPYMQNVVDIQKREAMRGAGIMSAQNQAQATNAGAFGGYREGIQRAENQRNLGTQMNDIQLKGQQMAFDNAQQQARMSQGQQMQYGSMQQALEQQKINQSIQDFANAQQYPLMQLGTMSNMLRGLPMQAQTTNQYVAAPNPISQGIGAAGAGASIYNATRGAEGGLPSEFKYAEGGIATVPRFDVGGEVESQLESMDVQGLMKQAQESSSPTVRAMAKRILRERQMEQGADRGAAPAGPMGVDYQAPQGMAGGGIIAFSKGETVDEEAAARAQMKSDREAVSGAARAVGDYAKDAAGKATAAGADLLTMIPRGIAGAVDSTLIRGARALGADVDYISPSLTPGDQSSDTMTPFYDRYIRSKEGKAAAPAAAPAAPAPAPASNKPRLATPADVAARTPEQKAEQARLAAIYESQRSPAAPATPAAPTANEGIKGAPVRATGPAKATAVAPAAATEAAPAAAGITAAPAVGADGKPVFSGALAAAEKAAYEAQQEANLPEAEFLKRVKEGTPENVAAAEYRKQVMDERANSKAENERQRQMRLAQFFAKWGSTPGPTLAAGLSALEKSLPDMIADEAGFKKAKRELDKIQFDIDNATRLEELGNKKEARALKEKAADRAMQLNQTLSQAKSAENTARIQQESSKYSADANIRIAELRERSDALNRLAGQRNADDNKKFGQYQTASQQEILVNNRIAAEENGKQHLDDVKLVNNATLVKPSEMTKEYADSVATAQRRIQTREKNWATQLETAKKNTERAYSRVSGGEPAAPTTTGKAISKAEFDKLPSGARFTAPDGSIRTKP